MNDSVTPIRDAILKALLPDIAFDGWAWPTVEKAAVNAGFDKSMAKAVFSGGLADVIGHFSDWADRAMLKRLEKTDSEDMRVRDRIRLAVATRLEILLPWKEALRLATRYWSVPHRSPRAARLVWRTADRIWDWAGDTATDYNRYTKRTLLAGVLTSTTLAWLADKEAGLGGTLPFLDRRIENVMKLGRTLGKFRKTG